METKTKIFWLTNLVARNEEDEIQEAEDEKDLLDPETDFDADLEESSLPEVGEDKPDDEDENEIL